MYIDESTFNHKCHFRCELTFLSQSIIIVESLDQPYFNKTFNGVYSLYVYFVPRDSIFVIIPKYTFHTRKHEKQFRD